MPMMMQWSLLLFFTVIASAISPFPKEVYVERLFTMEVQAHPAIFGDTNLPPWVIAARQALHRNLGVQNRSPRVMLGDIVKPEAEIPMRGWGYKLPASVAALTIEEFADRFLGAEADTESVCASERQCTREDMRKATEAEVFMGLSQEEFLSVHANPSALPLSYDFFREYPVCTPLVPYTQGSCGSCWAFATAESLTFRMCKLGADRKTPPPRGWALSVQDLISCVPITVSSTGNGCISGKTNAAMRYAAERALVSETCMPYESGAKGSPFKTECLQRDSCSSKWFGGGAARVSYFHLLAPEVREKAIMKAIMTRGPVSATFKMPVSFIGYRGQGIYRAEENTVYVTRNSSNPDGSIRTSHPVHAVTIVGWGVEDGVKFWLCMNHWGAYYPGSPQGSTDNVRASMFRIVRGEDMAFIESTAVSGALVDLPADPFKDGAVPLAPTELPPQAYNVCENKFAKGYCVDKCPGGREIMNPNVPCTPPASALSRTATCCQPASSIPQTPCERLMDGASCESLTGCVLTARVARLGLCPSSEKPICCVPSELGTVSVPTDKRVEKKIHEVLFDAPAGMRAEELLPAKFQHKLNQGDVSLQTEEELGNASEDKLADAIQK